VSIEVHSFNFQVQDAGGETFQLKENFTPVVDTTKILRLDLTRFVKGENLVIYGGDKNRKLDYPVKLLGFNFEFVKSDQPGKLTVNPSEFDKTDDEMTDAGGGAAVAMN